MKKVLPLDSGADPTLDNHNWQPGWHCVKTLGAHRRDLIPKFLQIVLAIWDWHRLRDCRANCTCGLVLNLLLLSYLAHKLLDLFDGDAITLWAGRHCLETLGAHRRDLIPKFLQIILAIWDWHLLLDCRANCTCGLVLNL